MLSPGLFTKLTADRARREHGVVDVDVIVARLANDLERQFARYRGAARNHAARADNEHRVGR